MRMEKNEEPAVVCLDGEELKLDENEVQLLALGPKFCVMKNLCEETFEVELEECIMKYRWEIMAEEKSKKDEDQAYTLIEAFFTGKENEEMNAEIEEARQIEEAKCRMIFDPETLTMDLSNRRATDLKKNARVIFPKR